VTSKSSLPFLETISLDINQLLYSDKGYGHKIWYIEGYSSAVVRIDKSKIRVYTDFFSIEAPNSPRGNIKIISMLDDESMIGYEKGFIKAVAEQTLEKYLNEKVFLASYDEKFEVRVFLMTTPPSNQYIDDSRHISSKISYCHRNCWGSTNPFHGHHSTITFMSSDLVQNDFYGYSVERMVKEINDCILINLSDVVSDSDDELKVKYSDYSGETSISIQKKHHKHLVIPTDQTSVNGLMQYLIKKNIELLIKLNIFKIVIYEGGNRGVTGHVGSYLSK
jgi:hypothetical protein